MSILNWKKELEGIKLKIYNEIEYQECRCNSYIVSSNMSYLYNQLEDIRKRPLIFWLRNKFTKEY